MKVFLLAIFLSVFVIQFCYCQELSIYIYKTDKVLLKIQNSNNDSWQYIFEEDVYKQGNIIRKIYKPYEDNKWKNDWLINLSKTILGNSATQQIDNVLYFRLIKFLEERTKSNYSADIPQIKAKVYLVNKMMKSQPDDILTKQITNFAYGFETTETEEIKKMLSKGYDSVILPQSFKESFYAEMKDYYAKIPKSINIRLCLYLIPTLLTLIILTASVFYIRAISQRAYRNNQLLKRRLADLDTQLKTENEKITQQYKNELAEKEKECRKTIKNLWQLVSDRIINAKLPISRIKELSYSIASKTNTIEIVRKKMNEILQDIELGINIQDNIGKIHWYETYNIMLDRLMKTIASLDAMKINELIARDVVTIIVSAIDMEKNINGNIDSGIEKELKSLMELVGIKEIDVKLGEVYNPDLHELIIDNSKSMTTDRQQKITKIISRGLILPDGKIIKAKVSIQR